MQEANAIGTAWLRLDLLPANAQPGLRDLFRRYLDTRLAAYRKIPDREAVRAKLARANALHGEIWTRATTACGESPSPLTAQLIPALNDMFDIATTRTATGMVHPPTIIFVLVFTTGG